MSDNKTPEEKICTCPSCMNQRNMSAAPTTPVEAAKEGEKRWTYKHITNTASANISQYWDVFTPDGTFFDRSFYEKKAKFICDSLNEASQFAHELERMKAGIAEVIELYEGGGAPSKTWIVNHLKALRKSE